MDEQEILTLCRKVRNANNMIGEDDDVYCCGCNKVYSRYYYSSKHKLTRKHLKQRHILIREIEETNDDRLGYVLYFILHKN